MTTIQYRVIYGDTDQMRVVYYANYYRFFEMVRNEIMREAGYTYETFERDGFLMPVIESRCKYITSARYDDLLEISGRTTMASGVRCRIECEVRRNGELLCCGYTTHACIKSDTGRPFRIPDKFLQLVEPSFDSVRTMLYGFRNEN